MNRRQALIIDDDPRARKRLAVLLRERDFRVHHAGTAERGRHRAEVDVVFVDQHLPDGTGVDLLAELRARNAERPVVLVTGHAYTDTVVDAMRAGATDVLVKPVDAGALDRSLARIRTPRPHPATPEAWQEVMEHAVTAWSNGDHTRAWELGCKALAMRPGRGEALNLLGAIAEEAEGPIEGERFYRAALALTPTCVQAQRNLERTTTHPEGGVPDVAVPPAPQAPSTG